MKSMKFLKQSCVPRIACLGFNGIHRAALRLWVHFHVRRESCHLAVSCFVPHGRDRRRRITRGDQAASAGRVGYFRWR